MKSIMLLRVADSDTYFVVPGVNFGEPGHTPDASAYWVEEHTCPSNLTRFPVLTVNKDGVNHDPHGVFEFIEEVQEPEGWRGASGPSSGPYEDIFPALAEIVAAEKLMAPKAGDQAFIDEASDFTAAQSAEIAFVLDKDRTRIIATENDIGITRDGDVWLAADVAAERMKQSMLRTMAISVGRQNLDEDLTITFEIDHLRKQVVFDFFASTDLGRALILKIDSGPHGQKEKGSAQ